MSLNITYHSIQSAGLPKDGLGGAVNVLPPQVGKEVVALSASGAIQTENVIARLVADELARIEIGTAPTANSSSMVLPASAVEYVIVPAASRIAVIAG